MFLQAAQQIHHAFAVARTNEYRVERATDPTVCKRITRRHRLKNMDGHRAASRRFCPPARPASGAKAHRIDAGCGMKYFHTEVSHGQIESRYFLG